MCVAARAPLLICWLCSFTLAFERVQHSMRDGDISWGSGVHFDGVEMRGNDGEDMVIKNDKVVEDDVKGKKGEVLKNYLAQKILPGLGEVETVANLPAAHKQLGQDKTGQALTARAHMRKAAGERSAGAAAATGVKRKDLALVAKRLRDAIARSRARVHARTNGAAAKAPKAGVTDADERAAAADALSRLEEVGQWEREQEAQAQYHWGLHIGRVVWVIGLLVLLIPASPGHEQSEGRNYDNYDGAEVEMTES